MVHGIGTVSGLKGNDASEHAAVMTDALIPSRYGGLAVRIHAAHGPLWFRFL
jgi:hypothetical protein